MEEPQQAAGPLATASSDSGILGSCYGGKRRQNPAPQQLQVQHPVAGWQEDMLLAQGNSSASQVRAVGEAKFEKAFV